MKKFNIIALILILSSCTSVPQFQPVNLVDTTLIDYPEKGIVVFATLGERLVAKGYKQDGPAYEIEAGMLVDNDESFLIAHLQPILVNQTLFHERTPQMGICVPAHFIIIGLKLQARRQLIAMERLKPLIFVLAMQRANSIYKENLILF